MSPGWPVPVDILNETGGSPVVLLCEHASNHIPDEYDGLGLSAAARESHIAWDIGAAALTRVLSARIDAPAFLAPYSRLLIDLNRPLDVAASIPTMSERSAIPGNADLPRAERERRIARIFRPFHDAVSRHLDRRRDAGRPARIVSIHSFTPVYRDIARPWHAGVLYDRAAKFGQGILSKLADPDLNVAANVPYGVSYEEDYALPVHGDARGLDAVLLEIRDDGLRADADRRGWAERLAVALATDQE